MIARDLIGFLEGERLPTIAEYAKKYDSSRGIVQNALAAMEDAGAIQLEKKGKGGTFLLGKSLPVLFTFADLAYITASMAPPLNKYHASIATGICASIADCPATFNFAFMHSSESRAKALQRMVYDFIIVSHHAARRIEEKYPDLQTAHVLKNSLYSPPFVLYSNRKGVHAIQTGDRVSVDPNSNDQYELTMKLCQGLDVEFAYEPYLATRIAFTKGRVDFVVQRQEEMADAAAIPAEIIEIADQDHEATIPAVMVNRTNYGMDMIVRHYLRDDIITGVQKDVLAGRQEASFY